VAILGGAGPISTGVAGLVAEVGAELAGASIPARVGGSPVLDAVVYRGVKAAKPDAEVQAFALDGDPVADASGMKHLRVHDFLVLNELVATGARGLVVVPDGSRPLATLFISACDLQTRQIEPLPLVVIDPEGRFAQLRRVMRDCMLSASRRYIDPGDLDLFTLTGTAREAARAARASPARKDDLPRTQTEG
jgi:predicted Rossmann-fold nucleotide-binding protein